jgi:hypothetical protein
VWQTDNRSEHFVLMVRTAEEIVLVSPGGDIESGSACYDGVPCPAWANVFRGVIHGNPRLASVFQHRTNLGGVRPLPEIDDFSIPKREEIEDVEFFRASVLREHHIRAPMRRRLLPLDDELNFLPALKLKLSINSLMIRCTAGLPRASVAMLGRPVP